MLKPCELSMTKVLDSCRPVFRVSDQARYNTICFATEQRLARDLKIGMFELMLYVPVNNFTFMLGHFLGLLNIKERIVGLSQGHNTVPPVRLVQATP